MTVRAEADGDGYVLSGVKSPVEAGAEADQLLVTATTDAGVSQFLVPRDADGVTVTPLRSVDLVRRYARIQFDGVRVPGLRRSWARRARSPTIVEHQLQIAAW